MIRSNNLVSVVIPTYNRAHYLKQAIDSIISQTHSDFEIIVVDDASTDNTKEIVCGYGSKVRYIFQDNKERGAARNNGIKNSCSNYIAFLDSDDMWLPNHLEVCLDALNGSSEAGLSFSGTYIIDENRKVISRLPFKKVNGSLLNEIVARYSSHGCNASSCLVRREIFEKSGYFNEDRDLSGSEDWEMWVRIASVTNFVSTNTFSALVRFHALKTSINSDRMAKSMKKSLDLVFENQLLASKLIKIKNQAYSRLHTVIAINYYAQGKMKESRINLKNAIKLMPTGILLNRDILYTYIRTFFGRRFSFFLRRIKWYLSSKFTKIGSCKRISCLFRVTERKNR